MEIPDRIEVNDGGLVTFTIDRELMQNLERAKTNLAETKNDEAIQLLETILKHPFDTWYRANAEDTSLISIKGEARRIISELPPDAKELFTMHFSTTAEKQLQAAIESGEMEKIIAVERSFPFTKAGNEATWLYARYCLEHGQAISAALELERLWQPLGKAAENNQPALNAREQFGDRLPLLLSLAWYRAGNQAKALELLQLLKKKSPRYLFPGEGSLDMDWDSLNASPTVWLEKTFGPVKSEDAVANNDWPIFRSQPSRVSRTKAGMPLLFPRWEFNIQSDLARYAKDAGFLQTQIGLVNRTPSPVNYPLLVGDLVLLQCNRQLLGLDAQTGKLRWLYPSVPRPIESKAAVENDYNSRGQQNRLQMQNLVPKNLKLNVSADSEAAYFLEDFAPPSNLPQIFNGRFGGFNGNFGQNLAAPEVVSNLLCSLSFEREGALNWQVGGRNGEGEPKLAGTYFFGAPLPLNNMLYILGEQSSELSLYCLSPKTGKVVWSQPLVRNEIPLNFDYQRRPLSCVPSYADGLLICPTNCGALMAIDLEQRMLRWAQSYPVQFTPFTSNQARQFLANNNYYGSDLNRERWADGAAIISDGVVLLSPPESDLVLGFELATGKILWRMNRSEMLNTQPLYIESLGDSRWMIVGKDSLECYQVEKKKHLWQIKFETAKTSGRGYLSNQTYYQPLSSGEIAQIDIELGKVVTKIRSYTDQSLGNMIATKNFILSVNEGKLSAFYALSGTKSLSSSANGSASVTNKIQAAEKFLLLGQQELSLDHFDQAISNFKHAHELQESPMTKAFYGQALLQGLRLNYRKYESQIDLLKELLATTPLRRSLSLELVQHALREKQFKAAVQELSWFCQQAGGEDIQANANGKIWISADRQLQKIVQQNFIQNNSMETEQFWQLLQQELQQLFAVGNLEATQRFLKITGPELLSAALANELLQQYTQADRQLDLELITLDVLERVANETSKNIEVADVLCSALVERLQRRQAKLDLENFQQHLQVLIAARMSDKTLTKKDALLLQWEKLIKSISSQKEQQPFVDVKKTWTTTTPPSEASRLQVQNTSYYALAAHQDRGPFHNQTQLVLQVNFNRTNPQQNNTPYQLLAYNEVGQVAFSLPIIDLPTPDSGSFGSLQDMLQVRFVGHLLLMQHRFVIDAYDTSQLTNGTPKRIWQQDLTSAFAEDNTGSSRTRFRLTPQGRSRATFVDANEQLLLGVWFPNTELVCVQRGQKLFALDNRTGKVLWMRNDAVNNCNDITGDQNHLAQFAYESNGVQNYSVIDGEKTSTCDIPFEPERLGIVGTQLLCSKRNALKTDLKLIDLMTGKPLWNQEFNSPNCKVQIINQREVAVCNPKGEIAILALQTGEIMTHAKMKFAPSVTTFQVWHESDRYLVLVAKAFENSNPLNIVAINNTPGQSNVLDGMLYAIEPLTGKILWENTINGVAPVQNQASQSPLLFFAANILDSAIYQNVPPLDEARKKLLMTHHLIAIDKQNGKMIYDKFQPMSQLPRFLFTEVNSSEQQIILHNDLKEQFKFSYSKTSASNHSQDSKQSK